MAEVRMPKMGDGMEEGTVLRWIKQEGDSVAADEPIAEIETDKANVEMPAEESGTLTKILVKAGETVPVGAVIAHIGEVAASPAKTNGAPAEEKAPEAREESEAPRKQPALGPSEERIKASPLARNMARKLGIDLALITGSGPGGRVVERDIQAFADKGTPTGLPTMPSDSSRRQPGRKSVQPSESQGPGKDIDLSRMRKTIARRTLNSKQTVPHFYLVMPVEMDRALKVIDELNATPSDGKVTINDLIIKACAFALDKFPEVNVTFTAEEKLRMHQKINIGVAVGTDDGLTVPVIPDCGTKTLRQISSDARELIGKARGGQLTPAEMSGGTFSISNLGMFGVEEFAAIINPPESAILAVGAVLAEVVVGPDGGLTSRKRMRITLSCDHRTVDGLLGAKFLQEVRRLLESPYELLA